MASAALSSPGDPRQLLLSTGAVRERKWDPYGSVFIYSSLHGARRWVSRCSARGPGDTPRTTAPLQGHRPVPRMGSGAAASSRAGVRGGSPAGEARGAPQGEETQPASPRPFSADAMALPTPAFPSAPDGQTQVLAAATAGGAGRCAGRCAQVSAGAEGTAPLTCTAPASTRRTGSSPTADIHPTQPRPANPACLRQGRPPAPAPCPAAFPRDSHPPEHPQHTLPAKTHPLTRLAAPGSDLGGSGCCRDHQPGTGPTGDRAGPQGFTASPALGQWQPSSLRRFLPRARAGAAADFR